MDDYRHVLYEWNDSINRNLALVQQYFGDAMRKRLDHVIGSAFVGLGRSVERLWAAKGDLSATAEPKGLDRQLDELNSLVYGFNLQMIRAIQAGAIGWPGTEHHQQSVRHDDAHADRRQNTIWPLSIFQRRPS